MRKVIKNVVKYTVAAICTVLVAMLALPLVVSLLVGVPAVQRALVSRTTSAISAKLGTRVSIDRIELKRINHVVVEGFYVEDFEGDTLLWVPRLVAPVVEWGVGRAPLTFGVVELTGAQLWLQRDRTDSMNISRVVRAISGPGPGDPDSHFHMRIMGIETHDLSFGLLRYDNPFVDEGIDWNRFVIRGTRISVSDFTVDSDTVGMRIRSLAFDERSGFRMDRLSARHLRVSRGAVMLDDVDILSSGSRIRAPQVYITDGKMSWDGFDDFIENIPLDIDMAPSRVTSSLVGWFLPAVAGWGLVLDDVEAHTRGAVAAMSGEITRAGVMGASLGLDFTSRGLPDLEKSRFEGSVEVTGARAATVQGVMESLALRPIPEKLRAALERWGDFSFAGRFAGRLRDFEAGGVLTSDAGELYADARIVVPEGGGLGIDGHVGTPKLALGRITGVEGVGSLTGEATLDARFNRGEIEGRASGKIAGVEIRGHRFGDISLDVRSGGGLWSCDAHSRDVAADFDLSATVHRRSGVPRGEGTLEVRRADLAAMGIAIRDSVSLLTGRIEASLSGTGLDDADGTVTIRNASFTSPRGTVATSGSTITARGGAAGKYLALRSEFVDADFHSRTSYRELWSRLGGFVRSTLPLPGPATADSVLSGGSLRGGAIAASAPSNYSMLKLRTKRTNALLKALSSEVGLAEGSELSFMFNPWIRAFSLHASSEFVEWKGMLLTGLSLEADNIADSLVIHLGTADIYTGAVHFPGFALHGGARERRANLSARLSDAGGNFSAVVGLDIEASQSLRLRFSPSHITLDDRTWHIAAGEARWTPRTGVTLDSLAIYSANNPRERLTAAGVISPNPSDTLRVRLSDFDLSPAGRFLGDGRIEVGGRASGYVDVSSALATARMDAAISLNGLSLNGHVASPLRFTSRWDERTGRVRFGVSQQRLGREVIRGTVSPSTGALDGIVELSGLDAGLLDALPGEILEKSDGKFDLALRIDGTLRRPRMNGHIDIPRFETTVKFTKARYTLENGRIGVTNSVLALPPTTVRDGAGGEADFSMNIDLGDPTRIETSIDAVARGLLAFDTGPETGEAFYGRIMATGTVGIRSGAAGTRMKISARTDRGTRIFLPLDTRGSISRADFVTFAPRSRRSDTTGVLARKRLLYEGRMRAAASERGPGLDIDITAALTPEAEVRLLLDPLLGKGITANGQGVVDLRINPSSEVFTMTGDYVISQGRFDFSMMDVFNKEFVIAPGSTLRWSDSPADASLGVKAAWRVRTSLQPLLPAVSPGGTTNSLGGGRSTVPVDCVIALAGRLSEPEITFDIELPSADPDARLIAAAAMNTPELKSMQFLSLVTTGNFAADNSITGQSTGAGAIATGAVGVDILTNQLSNLLSSDDYNIYFRYRPQSDYTGNQFDVGLSTEFIDNRLLLEIEGNYVDNGAAARVGKNTSNLAGDVSLTWMIDRTGNLRLKVFSQTIDRLNETQGLQESGLGIYWKRDFDSPGDIFRRKRTTFAADTLPARKSRRKGAREPENKDNKY